MTGGGSDAGLDRPWLDRSFLASPDQVCDWRMVLGFAAAEEVGILGALPDTAPGLASRLGLDEPAVRAILDLLVAWDVVRSDRRGKYDLGPLAPNGEASSVLRHHARALQQWFSLSDRLQGVVRTDPQHQGPFPTGAFLAALAPGARHSAPAVVDACLIRFPDARRVLDLGGGHGEYALEFARRGCQVTLQDRPAVIEVLEGGGRLAVAGVDLFTGDFFSELAAGPFDLVFCAGVTDTYDAARNLELLRRVRALLAPGGRLALMSFLRGHHPAAAIFAVQAVVMGAGGRTHAEEEYRQWLAGAGYQPLDVADVEGGRHTVLFATTS